MKKEKSRIFAFLFITLLLVSLIAAIVAADEAANREAAANSGKSVGERIADWWDSSSFKFSDQFKTSLSKILLMILVILIVYSVMSFVPIVPAGKDYINWLIAIIVGVLSFLFVSADNVRYILINYEALGVILTSLFPFLILLVFSYRLRENNPGIANILNPALFIGFLLYVGSKWLTYKPSVNTFLGTELAWIYPLTFALTAVWLVLERKIWHFFFKKELLGAIQKFNNMNLTELVAELNRLQHLEQYLTDPKLLKMLQERRKYLQELIKHLP